MVIGDKSIYCTVTTHSFIINTKGIWNYLHTYLFSISVWSLWIKSLAIFRTCFALCLSAISETKKTASSKTIICKGQGHSAITDEEHIDTPFLPYEWKNKYMCQQYEVNYLAWYCKLTFICVWEIFTRFMIENLAIANIFRCEPVH